ncbi:hypothetical protein ASF12_17165 [Paenibacillus sp. Leaf72]|nr:hypothetical protein ASF12_17165 [Paenibacillus sp. Leaf72]
MTLGGKTLFWNGISPRMDLHQLEYWPIPIQEMEAYYSIAEQVMSVTNRYTDGSSFTDILRNRLHQNGFPTATTTPIAANLQPTAYGQVPSDVFFSSTSFLAEAMNNRPYDLAVKARAGPSVRREWVCYRCKSYISGQKSLCS